MRKKVVLAGSGISVAPPSNLPSWWGYNKELISAIKEKALEQCPNAREPLAAIDVEKNLPVQCISEIIVNQGAGSSYFPLLSLLNSSKPNAYHFALAELARQHKLDAIVTTNFDTLIEAAFMEEVVPLSVASKAEEIWDALRYAGCKCIKVHGTAVDDKSMIDTVSQKARGLAAPVRLGIAECFKDSDIFVLGFSGADLDFDIDYFPFAEAIQSGSKIKWIMLPDSKLNKNVIALKDKYCGSFEICSQFLPSFFSSLGIDTSVLKGQDDGQRNGKEVMEHMHEEMLKLFSQPHIGRHGCVGYCLYLLDAIGEKNHADQLADEYEKSFDHGAVNPMWVTGIMSLASHRMHKQEWDSAELWYRTAIHCISVMRTNNEKLSNMLGTNKQVPEDSIVAEEKLNLSTCFCNLGLVFFYKGDYSVAIEMFTKAKEYAQSINNIKQVGVILFNLARTKLHTENDINAFLSEINRAASYCRSSGNLSMLAEILMMDCEYRFGLGEYYLAQKDIEELDTCVKNIDRRIIADKHKCLKADFYLRNGQKDEFIEQMKTMLEDPLFIWDAGIGMLFYDELYQTNPQGLFNDELTSDQSGNVPVNLNIGSLFELWINTAWYELSGFQSSNQLSEDDLRKLLIYSQAVNNDSIAAAALEEIMLSYARNHKWERVIDLAECLLHKAKSTKQKGIALYQKGCGLVEIHDYQNAKKAFSGVIELGTSACKTHLGWAYIEIASIDAMNAETNEEYYRKGKEILSQVGEFEMVSGCARYIRALKSVNRKEEAKSLLQDLLGTQISGEHREYLEAIYENLSNNSTDELIRAGEITDISPENIADYALRLFEDENSHETAWTLINLAKEKYLARGDMIGAAKCENNMGNFCKKEDNPEESLRHFIAAFEIKKAQKDYFGAAGELGNIISLYVDCHQSIDISEQVAEAELLLPIIGENSNKYRLCYCLLMYSVLNNDLPGAMKYAAIVDSGMNQIPGDKTLIRTINDKVLNTVHSSFNSNQSVTVPLADKMREARRCYKEGNISYFNSLINELREENIDDYYILGCIEGDVGNIYLNGEAYPSAIDCFDKALDLFAKVSAAYHDDVEALKKRAMNGKMLALFKQGKVEEYYTLMREYLYTADLTDPDSVLLLMNYCNRLLTMSENMGVNSPEYQEIEKCLEIIEKNEKADVGLLGAYHHLRGNFCLLSGNYSGAQKEFAEAITKFRIINSLFAAQSEMALEAAEQLAKDVTKPLVNNIETDTTSIIGPSS